MALFGRKNKYSDAVEDARVAVASALASFGEAQAALDAATETYEQRVAENTAYIQSLNARNEELTADAAQARRVSARLGELTA